MTTTQLRQKIKKAIDKLPAERLKSVADYVQFLSQSPLQQRLKKAEEAFARGKHVNWQDVCSTKNGNNAEQQTDPHRRS